MPKRLNFGQTHDVEMFYLNTIEQLFLFVEQLYQLEVFLPYSRLLTGIPILAVFLNLKWNSNKTSLIIKDELALCIEIFATTSCWSWICSSQTEQRSLSLMYLICNFMQVLALGLVNNQHVWPLIIPPSATTRLSKK